jgi:hypothetical protein
MDRPPEVQAEKRAEEETREKWRAEFRAKIEAKQNKKREKAKKKRAQEAAPKAAAELKAKLATPVFWIENGAPKFSANIVIDGIPFAFKEGDSHYGFTALNENSTECRFHAAFLKATNSVRVAAMRWAFKSR